MADSEPTGAKQCETFECGPYFVQNGSICIWDEYHDAEGGWVPIEDAYTELASLQMERSYLSEALTSLLDAIKQVEGANPTARQLQGVRDDLG